MSYDDTRYVDRQTMAGNCDVSVSGTYPSTDTPDDAPAPQPVGTKFISQGEPATSEAANRARYQLALNTDILKEPLDSLIATQQVGSLTGFTGSSIDIDPTGGAHDLDAAFSPAGYLYVGNSSYVAAGQEEHNTLFQLLDENYNEVVIDGEEVKISSITGTTLGSGFYNGGAVTLNLSHTIPSGNYRLAYARDATLATLPDDALIRADIRGLHESAAESQRKAAFVCGPVGSVSADYVGADAIIDALADLATLGVGYTLYVQPGTYNCPTGVTAVTGVSIIGTGSDDADVVLTVSASVSWAGTNALFQNLKFDVAPGSVAISFPSGYQRVVNCEFECSAPTGGEHIFSESGNQVYDGLNIVGLYVDFGDGGQRLLANTDIINSVGRAFYASGPAVYDTISQVQMVGAGADPAVDLEGDVEYMTFENCYVSHSGTGRSFYLHSYATRVNVRNSVIRTNGASCLEAVRVSASAGYGRCSFSQCTILHNNSSTALPAVYVTNSDDFRMEDCRVVGADAITAHLASGVTRAVISNCYLEDTAGADYPVLQIDDAEQAVTDNCHIVTSGNTGSIVPAVLCAAAAGQAVSFRNCQVDSENMALFRVASAVLGKLHIENCDFSQTRNGAPVITGDEIFDVTANPDTAQAFIGNAKINVTDWDGTSQCVLLTGVNGNNISVDFTGMAQGLYSPGTMVYVQDCNLENLTVDFGTVAPSYGAAAADGAAIKIMRRSYVKDMQITGLDGDWNGTPNLPVLHVEGEKGSGSYSRAEVDGLRIDCETTWEPYYLCPIRIEKYGTIRSMEWVEMVYDDSYAITTLIGLGFGGDPTEARLLESFIQVGQGPMDPHIYQVVCVYGDGEGAVVRENKFDIWPWEQSSGPPPEIWPRRIIRVGDLATSLTWPGSGGSPTFANGCKFGRVCENFIHWQTGADYDLDPALSQNGALVYVEDEAYFWTFDNNVMVIEDAIPSGNYAIWVDNASASIGGATLSNAADGLVNGHTFFGNKVWALDQVATSQGIVFFATGTPLGGNLSTSGQNHANQAVGNTP